MMTSTTTRSTSRTLAAAAAVAAASTLAACGSSDSTTSAEAPAVSSSSSSSSTTQAPSASSSSSSSSAPSASTSAPSKAKAAPERASRSQQRQALTGVKYVNWSQVEAVPNKTVYVYSADMPKGASKVTQAGQPGTATVTYRTVKNGDKVVSSNVVDAKVTKSAVRRVVTVGTGATQQAAQTKVSRTSARSAITSHAAPKAAASSQPKAATSAGAGGSGNAGMWNNIARCESGNNWSINTGNGFYGGLQFTQQTWAGFGGTAYAPRADMATPSQQMAIADKVMAVQGRGAWPVCGR